MKKFGLLAATCGAAAFALASLASASPLSGAATGLNAADGGLVELVHGCHREVRRDRYGWHYHRDNCRRVDVDPDFDPDYPPPRPCFWVGPVRVCP